jgi:surface polysaccharide O-acyltransferase-like enzyme
MGREPYWDWVKGISILCVIGIHSFSGAGGLSDQHWFPEVISAAIEMAVPMFLAISGYFQGRRTPVAVGQRLLRLWAPYFVWSLIFLGLRNHEALAAPGEFLFTLATGRGISIGYFVIVLSQMILLAPLLGRLPSVRAHIIVIAALTAAGVVFNYAISPDWRFPWPALPFIAWYPTYHLGFLVGRYPQVRPTAGAPLLVAATLFLVGSIVEPALTGYGLAARKLTTLGYAMALFLWFAGPGQHPVRPGPMAWLGRNSYFIYLFHLLPLGKAAQLAARAGIAPATLRFLFLFIITASASAATAWLGRRFLPKRLQPWVLG